MEVKSISWDIPFFYNTAINQQAHVSKQNDKTIYG
jgi:hypothetical protein